MTQNLKKVWNRIADYFTGRDIKESYDSYIELIRNESGNIESRVRNLEDLRRVDAVGTSIVPNCGELAAIGCSAGYAVSDDYMLILASLGCVVVSEVFRYFARKSAKGTLETLEVMQGVASNARSLESEVKGLEEPAYRRLLEDIKCDGAVN